MLSMAKTIAKNETRDMIIKFLKENEGKAFTLKEIGEAIGKEIKSGTTNVLITEGILVNGEDKMVEVVKKEPRKTYTIGDLSKYDKAE